jgi:putative SOS response-associated peptidase YedK
MCGRYTLHQKAQAVAKRFNLATVVPDLRPNYNVAPSQTMPVITEDKNGKRQLEDMKWGIPRSLGKDFIKEIINTRADKAFGGFWKRTVLSQRCLIPADGFYEWQKSAHGKTPFYIHPKDLKLYAFAGIWDIREDEAGHKIKTYSIMTTDANEEMRQVHTRMPVILDRQEEALWLDSAHNDPGFLAELLEPYKNGGLEIYQVSADVNSPRNNDAHLLQAVT